MAFQRFVVAAVSFLAGPNLGFNRGQTAAGIQRNESGATFSAHIHSVGVATVVIVGTVNGGALIDYWHIAHYFPLQDCG